MTAKKKSLKFVSVLLTAVLILSSVLLLSSQPVYAATAAPTEDTSATVYNNPGMGWQLYFDTTIDGMPADVDAYLNSFSTASRNAATTLYVRASWAEFEPTQGNYVWNQTGSWIKKVENWAAANGKKLAFCIYVVCQDAGSQATPEYVQSDPAVTGNFYFHLKNGIYEWSPNENNTRFQELFGNFLTAFAAQYDNPNVVDYVDANGLGMWGESHWSYNNYLTDDQKEQVYHWIINTYSSRFKKVLLFDNYQRDYNNGIDYGFRYNLRDWGLKFKGYGMRRNSMGSPYFTQLQKDRINSNFPAKPVYAENYYHHNVSQHFWDQNYSTLNAALTQVLADAKYMHANTLDLRIPEDANAWTQNHMSLVNDFIINGGYRLVPTSITYPTALTSGSEFTVQHSWKNTGVGKLPNDLPNWDYKYKVAYALLNTSTGAPVYTFIDSAEPSDWIKGQTYSYSSKVSFVGVPSGTYDFAVAIVDREKNYSPAIKLGITNTRTSTGWYKLGTTTVSGNSTAEAVQTSAKAYTTSGQSTSLGSSVTHINDGGNTYQFFSNIGVTLPQYFGLNWGGYTVTTDRIKLSATYATQAGVTNIDVEYYDGKAWKPILRNKSITWSTNTGTAEEKEVTFGTYVVTTQLRIKVNSANLSQGRFTISEMTVPGKLSAGGTSNTNVALCSIASATVNGYLNWGSIKNITDGNYGTVWGTDPAATITFPQDIILDFNNNTVRVNSIKITTHYGQTHGITKLDVRYWNGNAWQDAALDRTFTYTLNNDTEEFFTIDFNNNNFCTTKLKITVEQGVSAARFALNDIEVWGWGATTAPEYYDFGRAGDISTTIPSDSQYPIYWGNDGYTDLAWGTSTGITFGADKYIEMDFQGITAAIDKITLAAWYGRNQGIKKVDVQYYDGGIWKTAAIDRVIYPDWTSTNNTMEYRDIYLDTFYTTKIRVIIKDAYLDWSKYALNEIYVYGYVLK